MKTATAALTALLAAAGGGVPLVKFDLYTFNLVGGGQLLYTTADFPVFAADATIWNPPKIDGSGGSWVSGITWQPRVILEDGTQAAGHWKSGLDSDTWTIIAAPRPMDLITGSAFPDTIGTVPWLQAAAAGALDNADVIVSRAYFATMPTWPIPRAGLSPVGTMVIFRGIVGAVDITTTEASITVNDYKSLLSQQSPPNVFQSSCRHRVYNSRCTLSAAAYTATGSAGSTSTRNTIAATVAAPGGSGTYALGTLAMTSGLNAGITRLVSSWTGGIFTLLNPLPFTVATGDTFSVTAGCNKSMATCTAFGNLTNFGGEPWIPTPEISMG